MINRALTLVLILLLFPAPSASADTPIYVPSIEAEYPHDPASFTQGLFIHDGKLYESSGGYGESYLALVDMETGNYFKKLPIEGRYFAEGIAPINGRIHMLTWRSGTGFIHSLDTLKQLDTFLYRGPGNKSEGWGLTHDSNHFIRSTGKPELHFHTTDDFTIVRTITVQDEGEPVRMLNELEYVGGMILANVWKKDRIAVIDPADGNVRAWIDLSLLRIRLSPSAGTANGIAYDRKQGKLYVTGKNWSKLFEISVKEVLWRQPVTD